MKYLFLLLKTQLEVFNWHCPKFIRHEIQSAGAVEYADYISAKG